MMHLLPNIAWHSLAGPHARYAVGTAVARRYAPGFSPILGFADIERPAFDALLPFCEAGEHFYCSGWSGAAPSGWRIDEETTLIKMVWHGAVPSDDDGGEATDLVRLGPAHAQQALELALLTKPGPFGPKTLELGEYFGTFDGDRLVAMAGERMHAGRLREISGVCTHPSHQGHGLARRLMCKLIQRQMRRDEVPFLHVMSGNTGARGLYERMGFANHLESVVRVVSPQSPKAGP